MLWNVSMTSGKTLACQTWNQLLLLSKKQREVSALRVFDGCRIMTPVLFTSVPHKHHFHQHFLPLGKKRLTEIQSVGMASIWNWIKSMCSYLTELCQLQLKRHIYLYCIVICRCNIWQWCLYLVFIVKIKLSSSGWASSVIRRPAAAANTDKQWLIEETSPADIISTQTRAVNHSLSYTPVDFMKSHRLQIKQPPMKDLWLFVYELFKEAL